MIISHVIGYIAFLVISYIIVNAKRDIFLAKITLIMLISLPLLKIIFIVTGAKSYNALFALLEVATFLLFLFWLMRGFTTKAIGDY